MTILSDTGNWETEADQISPESIKDLLFTNGSVQQFLEKDNKHFVVASKGIGKTLLLKYKRFLLENKNNKVGESGIMFVPHDRPYLDFVSNFGDLNKKQIEWCKSLLNIRKAWTFSLMLSISSYYYYSTSKNLEIFKDDLYEFETKYKGKYKKYYKMLIGKKREEPCAVMASLFKLSVSNMNNLLSRYYSVIEDIYRSIQSGVCVFIDRLDQALSQYGKEIWVSFQSGLLESAWDIMRINNHVKIYTSVRQEAYANYTSSDRTAISGEVSLIRYASNDLRNILDKHSIFYEGCESFYHFLGFEDISKPYSKETENGFHYLKRHTMGRPRDLVSICSRLSTARNMLSHDQFRKIVNETSNIEIISNVFDEIGFMLDTLSNKNLREAFLSRISKNVLSYSEIKLICRKFNKLSDCEGYNCKSCSGEHPFCDLYNAGLLGIIRYDKIKNDLRQSFVSPYDLNSFEKGSLISESKYYLVHPALQLHIENLRNRIFGKSYLVYNCVTIGQGYKWTDKCERLIEAQKLISEIQNVKLKLELKEIIERLEIDERILTVSKITEVKNKIENLGESAGKVIKIINLIETVAKYLPIP